jgi:ASC-1-like (ASCH) protein
MRQKFKEDMNVSLKKMEVEIKNAKTEIERSFKTGSEIVFEKEKVQGDIQKAMEALEQLNKMGGLDNIVLNSLKIAGFNMENSKPRQKMKQPSLPRKKTVSHVCACLLLIKNL